MVGPTDDWTEIDTLPDGRVQDYEGSSAKSAWALIDPRLKARKSRQVTDLEWTGNVYESEDGLTLFYFSGEH